MFVGFEPVIMVLPSRMHGIPGRSPKVDRPVRGRYVMVPTAETKRQRRVVHGAYLTRRSGCSDRKMTRYCAKMLVTFLLALATSTLAQDAPAQTDLPQAGIEGASEICTNSLGNLTNMCEVEIEYFSQFSGLDTESIQQRLEEDGLQPTEGCCTALGMFNEQLCNCDESLNQAVLEFVSQEDWDAVIQASAQSCNYTAIAGDLCPE